MLPVPSPSGCCWRISDETPFQCTHWSAPGLAHGSFQHMDWAPAGISGELTAVHHCSLALGISIGMPGIFHPKFQMGSKGSERSPHPGIDLIQFHSSTQQHNPHSQRRSLKIEYQKNPNKPKNPSLENRLFRRIDPGVLSKQEEKKREKMMAFNNEKNEYIQLPGKLSNLYCAKHKASALAFWLIYLPPPNLSTHLCLACL